MLGNAWRARVLHAINRTASTVQVIQETVRTHPEIDRAGKAGGESPDLIAVVGIKRANPAATQIGKEIDAGILRRKLADRRIVKRTADNRATIGVRILVNRI